MTDVRIKFSKHGPIRFLGHLDVMRYFQRSVRRAGIDVRYSEGYSPHQIMSFAQPLSVGATSDGEYLDLSLNREMDPGELCSCLNEVMHEGIVILACEILPERSDKSMTLVAAAEYLLRFRPGHEPLAAEALKTSMEKYLS
ncbi:MAG: DUF2344 domain-containing protein, partial [Butyrivibrio sp.]|nr:DUF2344 domain-containing protein [Butyrivibrio sp.]